MPTPSFLRSRYRGENGGLFCRPNQSGFSFLKLRKVNRWFDGIEEAGFCSDPQSLAAEAKLLSAADTLLARNSDHGLVATAYRGQPLTHAP